MSAPADRASASRGEVTEVLLLGSGGWIPTHARETCCLYVRRGTAALVVDAGTGVRHLVERPDLLEGVQTLDIVLTHFHLDHIVGLGYLPALHLGPRTVLWGPGAALYGASTRSILARLLAPPFFGAGIGSIASDVRELDRRSSLSDSLELVSRVQMRHSDPTLALRLDDVFTLCTDTAFDPENGDFAQGSATLLHEAWHEGPSTRDEIHSAAGEAGRIAAAARVERLVLVHMNPLLQSETALLGAARAEFPEAAVGFDGMPCGGA